MKRIYFYIGLGIGISLFILGLFDLKETKFGYESTTMLLGIIWLVWVWAYSITDYIKYRLKQLEAQRK